MTGRAMSDSAAYCSPEEQYSLGQLWLDSSERVRSATAIRVRSFLPTGLVPSIRGQEAETLSALDAVKRAVGASHAYPNQGTGSFSFEFRTDLDLLVERAISEAARIRSAAMQGGRLSLALPDEHLTPLNSPPDGKPFAVVWSDGVTRELVFRNAVIEFRSFEKFRTLLDSSSRTTDRTAILRRIQFKHLLMLHDATKRKSVPDAIPTRMVNGNFSFGENGELLVSELTPTEPVVTKNLPGDRQRIMLQGN